MTTGKMDLRGAKDVNVDMSLLSCAGLCINQLYDFPLHFIVFCLFVLQGEQYDNSGNSIFAYNFCA